MGHLRAVQSTRPKGSLSNGFAALRNGVTIGHIADATGPGAAELRTLHLE